MANVPIILHDTYEALRVWLENNVINFSSNTNISRITDTIYVGNMSTGTNLQLLRDLGVTHVISALSCFDPPYPNEFKYLSIFCHDWEFEPISLRFNESNAFIQDAIDQGGKVYIHCMSGISRSVTLTMAYLVTLFAAEKRDMSIADILESVRERRLVANPNPGFIAQLETFQKKIVEVDRPE